MNHVMLTLHNALRFSEQRGNAAQVGKGILQSGTSNILLPVPEKTGISGKKKTRCAVGSVGEMQRSEGGYRNGQNS